MTEYEYEYYSTFQKWPNTNTNIIRFETGDRIQIRILFALKKATEYEYEYYSVWKYWPNTNTNIIWLEKNIRIPNYSLTSAHCLKPTRCLLDWKNCSLGKYFNRLPTEISRHPLINDCTTMDATPGFVAPIQQESICHSCPIDRSIMGRPAHTLPAGDQRSEGSLMLPCWLVATSPWVWHNNPVLVQAIVHIKTTDKHLWGINNKEILILPDWYREAP